MTSFNPSIIEVILIAMGLALPCAALTFLVITKFFKLNKRVFIAIGVALIALYPTSWVMLHLPISINLCVTKTTSTNSINSSSSSSNDASIKPWRRVGLFLDLPEKLNEQDVWASMLKEMIKKYGVDLYFVLLTKGHLIEGELDVVWHMKLTSTPKISAPFQTQRELTWSMQALEPSSCLSVPMHANGDRAELNLDGDGKINFQVNGLYTQHELKNLIIKHASKEIGKTLAGKMSETWEQQLFEDSSNEKVMPTTKEIEQPTLMTNDNLPESMKIKSWIKHTGFLYGDLNVLWGEWDSVSNQDISDFVKSIIESDDWKLDYGNKDELLEKIKKNGPNSLSWTSIKTRGEKVGYLRIKLEDRDKGSSIVFFSESEEPQLKNYRFQIYWTEGQTPDQIADSFENLLDSKNVLENQWDAFKVIHHFPPRNIARDKTQDIRGKWRDLVQTWIERRPQDYRLAKKYIQYAKLTDEEKVSEYDKIIQRLTGYAKFYEKRLDLQISRNKLIKSN